MFSYLSPEERVRKDHPLQAIGAMADQALKKMGESIRRHVRQQQAVRRFPPRSCCGRS
jgi:hypothetical protein